MEIGLSRERVLDMVMEEKLRSVRLQRCSCQTVRRGAVRRLKEHVGRRRRAVWKSRGSQEIREELLERALMRYKYSKEEAMFGGSCQEIVEELSGDRRGAVRKEKESCYEREKVTSGEELRGKRSGSSR
jgi:hypothetical protein